MGFSHSQHPHDFLPEFLPFLVPSNFVFCSVLLDFAIFSPLFNASHCLQDYYVILCLMFAMKKLGIFALFYWLEINVHIKNCTKNSKILNFCLTKIKKSDNMKIILKELTLNADYSLSASNSAFFLRRKICQKQDFKTLFSL